MVFFGHNYFFLVAENRRLVSRVGGQRGGARLVTDLPQAADAELLGNAPVPQSSQDVDAPHVEVAIRAVRRNSFRQLR